MKTLSVNVARTDARSPVWVGRGLLRSIETLIDMRGFSSIVVIADSGPTTSVTEICTTLSIPAERVLTISGGESCKSIEGLESVWRFFVDNRIDRRSLVLAVGGGAISDLVGFAAATFMRGIACLIVPTTLLAHVDASIGGKSGINFAGVKNVVGAIKQPCGILVDIDTLQTLPERDYRSGFAEIVKHGLIADHGYFTTVTARNCRGWTLDEMVDIIFRSCEIKRDVVESDESEQGPRKNLNYGHTLGHAIEALALSQGSSVTHGEAIAIGMHAASLISHRQGLISAADLSTIVAGLVTVGLPTQLSHPMDERELLELIKQDKKNVAGKTRWTLLRRIGEAIFDQEVPDKLVSEAIRTIQPR